MADGWICMYRKVLENPVLCKDTDMIAVWLYILLSATHTDYDVEFQGKRITLKPGQLITGRKVIANHFNLSESKVQRILKKLESEHQIEQQTGTKNRIITVVNWSSYQFVEQRTEQQVNNNRTTTEQQVNNNRTTTEQQVNTNNNINNIDNVNNINNENNINNGINIIEGASGDESPKPNPKPRRFIPPTLEDVQQYCQERNNQVDPERWIDYYTSNGWMVGKSKMKDWKAAVRTWEKNGFQNTNQSSGSSNGRISFSEQVERMKDW